MGEEFAPEDLVCPHPGGCTVAPRVEGWVTTTIDAGSRWYRCYDGKFGYDQYNPGHGDTRFAPFDAAETRRRVPTMYLAETPTAALLETILHSVDTAGGMNRLTAPAVYEWKLREMLLAHVEAPAPLTVADLRDDRLRDLGLTRQQLAASAAEHYPCTRRIARDIHADDRAVAGIIWHSRQAELTGQAPAEVLVLFGDRAPSGAGIWPRVGPGSQNLHEGPGRDRVEVLARRLGVTVETGLDGPSSRQ